MNKGPWSAADLRLKKCPRYFVRDVTKKRKTEEGDRRRGQGKEGRRTEGGRARGPHTHLFSDSAPPFWPSPSLHPQASEMLQVFLVVKHGVTHTTSACSSPPDHPAPEGGCRREPPGGARLQAPSPMPGAAGPRRADGTGGGSARPPGHTLNPTALQDVLEQRVRLKAPGQRRG